MTPAAKIDKAGGFVPDKSMVPCIGIVSNFDDEQCKLAQAYVKAVADSGAAPLLIAPCPESLFDDVLRRVDGVLFTGGGDFTSSLFGLPEVHTLGAVNRARDVFEMHFFEAVMAWQLPVLGICRGMQLMNLMLGGDIYQDLSTEYAGNVLNHSQEAPRSQAVHEVSIQAATMLSQLLPPVSFVNSFHHQAVRTVAPGLKVAATAPDGVVEAVESSMRLPLMGVQWHPEALLGGLDAGASLKLFAWLREAARIYRKARTLQQQQPSIDTHCDTPMYMAPLYYPPQEFVHPSRVTPREMLLGGLDAVVMAVYVKQRACTTEEFAKAAAQTEDIWQRIDQYAVANQMTVVKTPAELATAWESGRKAIFKAIENGFALGHDLRNISRLAAQGLVYLTLCHNGHNDICDSASASGDEPAHGGLSDWGRRVVAELNRTGVLIDVSHAADETVKAVLDASFMPVFASHSSARTLCEHPRNLPDDLIKQIAARGGMVNICLYSGFLRREGGATIRDAVRHIHYVRDLVGVDHVGIGSDFDGGGGMAGCQSARDWFRFYTMLISDGYTDEDIRKIMGGNFLKLLSQVQQVPFRHILQAREA